MSHLKRLKCLLLILYLSTFLQPWKALASNPLNVSLPDSNIIHISCLGLQDGSIKAISMEPPGSLTFRVGVATNSNGQFTGLPKGIDTVYVSNAAGCALKLPFEILEPEEIKVVGQVHSVPCIESITGLVDVSTTGGVQPYSFEWFSNGVLINTDEDLVNFRATSYSFFVTDANGCSVNQFFTIPVLKTLKVSGELMPPRCPWEANGSIDSRISGGVMPYEITWKDTLEISNDISINNVITGYYKLIVKDSTGCQDSMSFFMPNPETIEVELETTQISCFGDDNGTVVVKPYSGVPPFLYRRLGAPIQSSRVFTKLVPGVEQFEVTDARGCISAVFPVVISSPDSVEIQMDKEIEARFGETISLMPILVGGQSHHSWLWQTDIELPDLCDTCDQQTIVVTQDFVLSVSVIDQNGCMAETKVVIQIKENKILLVPTGFSPNGDLVNDELVVHGTDDAQVESFQVFDRWGAMVYERSDFPTNDTTTGLNWAGTINGEEAQPGVYIWQATVRFRDGTKLNFNGETNLLR